MTLSLSKTMSNQELGEVFSFIGQVLAANGENQFRVRSYQNAAVVIEQQNEPLYEQYARGVKLEELPAIGETIAKKLGELFTTGTIKAFEKYVKDIPEPVFFLCKVPGIGVKRATVLVDAFQLKKSETAIQQLLQAGKEHAIAILPGFGEKSEAQIVKTLTEFKEHKRMSYEEAHAIALEVIQMVQKCPGIEHVEMLGSLRRKSPTVGDVDLGAVAASPKEVAECLRRNKKVESIVAAGEGLIRLRLATGVQVDLKFATKEEWGSFLQHFTGSKEHNIVLRTRAIKMGKSLSEHGFDGKGCATEEEVYTTLGLRWIPPEERVGGDEFERYATIRGL